MVKQSGSTAPKASQDRGKERKTAARSDKRKKRNNEGVPQVNFGTLHMNTLKRYKKHYQLREEWGNKAELVEIVSNHFNKQEVIEMDTVILFSHFVNNQPKD